jgi:hypothetical protein
MGATYFQDFKRDNGLPVTVEYSATGGEPDFDFPGHICDGGGSGPEIVILRAWPATEGHNRLASIALGLWLNRATRFGARIGRLAALPFHGLMRLDEWWRASLTITERERMEAWLAEHYVEEPYEPEY